ncbi:hypothetical protein ACFRCG_06645 [Embleya sp. NPDC056575]
MSTTQITQPLGSREAGRPQEPLLAAEIPVGEFDLKQVSAYESMWL